jgi:hypothetical protein
MPAAVLSDPLGIGCVFSDGRRSKTVLADVANPELARDLLLGLAGMVHPHGSVDAAGTIRHYVRALRTLVRTLAQQGFTGGAGELRRAQLVEYWMAASAAGEAGSRRMLASFAAAGGALDVRVAELVAGRAYNLQPFRRPLPPYDEGVWTRLRQAAEQAVSTAYRSHKTALAGAERGCDPRDAGCGLDNLRWLLAGSGPMNVFDAAAHLDVSVSTMRRRTGLLQASAELFPHLDVTAAYVLLFIFRIRQNRVRAAGPHSVCAVQPRRSRAGRSPPRMGSWTTAVVGGCCGRRSVRLWSRTGCSRRR